MKQQFAADRMQPTEVSGTRFVFFCLGGYLFSIAYGVTFLLPQLVVNKGGNEAVAGAIISIAAITTVISVLISGHLLDTFGRVKSLCFTGICLFAASLGFAVFPGYQWYYLSGLSLGLGWGIYYTLGPMLVANLVTAQRRMQFFALLSGSMMAGIGTAPLIGRVLVHNGFRIELAYLCSALTSVLGVVCFIACFRQLKLRQRPVVSRISLPAIGQILRSPAWAPILMVGLGACIFGGFSSFQASYASFYGYDYSLFFIGFMTAAITCRLLLAGFVAKRDPGIAAVLLSGLIIIALLMFIFVTSSATGYLIAAIIFGIGYGLTYSVINGLAADTAPDSLIQQTLLLFSLSYFIGVFGYPFIAGSILVQSGLTVLLYSFLVIAIINSTVAGYQLWRRLDSGN